MSALTLLTVGRSRRRKNLSVGRGFAESGPRNCRSVKQMVIDGGRGWISGHSSLRSSARW